MRLTVIPMSSGEYDVQVEKDEVTVTNYQVARPTRILDATGEDDPRRVIQVSFDYLLQRDRLELGHVVSLDDLWQTDADFAETLRGRLS
jgi:hypothetical protein